MYMLQIGGIVRSNMEDTLVKRYRNNTHNQTLNRVVTEAWDRMQVRVSLSLYYYVIDDDSKTMETIITIN